MGEDDEPAETAARLAEAALCFPDVVGLSAGAFGTISTPARGGFVHGVAVRSGAVEVGLVVRFGRPIPGVVTEVRDGLGPLSGGRAVHVFVEDVVAGLGGDAPSGG
ncbi:hypothetical protein KIK06_00520 [Nocardiopsis sp. EMB25]|uniref:hypothetical protein n=1 Tax=Nocardiopsis sp. EMB25 TaxID=2835867 RepID=UPI002284AE02|nr:hypothetical protein [Nocardiopsis sp. EMB25]MCY9782371.1 hypothetical protein [Nocardiopsis sp. EMB25]